MLCYLAIPAIRQLATSSKNLVASAQFLVTLVTSKSVPKIKVSFIDHQNLYYLCSCYHYLNSSCSFSYWVLHQSLWVFSLGYFLNIIYINIIKSKSHDHASTYFWLIKERSVRWPFQTHYMYLQVPYKQFFLSVCTCTITECSLYFHSPVVKITLHLSLL